MDVQQALTTERLALIARLRGLPAAEWDTPSLCQGWTVRHVLAHLTTPFLVPRTRMALLVARSGGISAAMDRAAHELARRPVDELLGVLEDGAGSSFRPPGLPLAAPLTDVVAHSADIRWALGDGDADWGEPQRLRPVLDFLVSPRAAAGFVPPRRLRGLRLVADDLDWSSGTGREVRGPALPLALGVLGRARATALLDGAGTAALAA